MDRIRFFHYLDPNFVYLIHYRFRRNKTFEASLCDIYDGSVYKEHSSFFSKSYNISFTLNYDGAPKFKSSNMQIWPVQLCINELPPKLRYNILMR